MSAPTHYQIIKGGNGAVCSKSRGDFTNIGDDSFHKVDGLDGHRLQAGDVILRPVTIPTNSEKDAEIARLIEVVKRVGVERDTYRQQLEAKSIKSHDKEQEIDRLNRELSSMEALLKDSQQKVLEKENIIDKVSFERDEARKPLQWRELDDNPPSGNTMVFWNNGHNIGWNSFEYLEPKDKWLPESCLPPYPAKKSRAEELFDKWAETNGESLIWSNGEACAKSAIAFALSQEGK